VQPREGFLPLHVILMAPSLRPKLPTLPLDSRLQLNNIGSKPVVSPPHLPRSHQQICFPRGRSVPLASSCWIPVATTGLALRALGSSCCAKCHSVSQFWIRVFVQSGLRSDVKRRKGRPLLLASSKSHGTRPTLTRSKRYRCPFIYSGPTHVRPGSR
jgi:hypothetical protein